MKNKIRACAALLLGLLALNARAGDNDTTSRILSEKESKAILDQVVKDGTIKQNALNNAVHDACRCIDSIESFDKTQQTISREIGACIDKEVVVYQTVVKIFESMNKSNNQVINISTDEDSRAYKAYYYEIERQLMDSCEALKDLVRIKDKVNKFSFSEDEKALQQYKLGLQLSNKEMFEDAIPYYQKAVEIDPKFTFAWDNLGICYRKTGQMDKAITAYKKSLEINPMGEMPLQNLAVAYEYKKDYAKAKDAYRSILTYFPEHVEAYYGLGRLYVIHEPDLPQALEYMCKAYNLYVAMKSPYRTDAETMISTIYGLMKKDKKEKQFNEILKKYNLSPVKN